MKTTITWIVTVVATAVITWNINEWLNKARPKAELMSVEFKEEASPAEFSVAQIAALKDFFDEEILEKIVRHVAGEQPTNRSDEVSSFIAELEMKKRAKGKIALDPTDVQAAIEKAAVALQTLASAEGEINQLLARNPDKIQEYTMMFRRHIDDAILNPYSTNEVNENDQLQDWQVPEWRNCLAKCAKDYEEASKSIKEGKEILNAEVKASNSEARQKKQFLNARVLITNTGNKPTSIHETAVLQMLGSASDQIILSSTTGLDETVIPAGSHKVILFSLAKNERNTPQVLRTAMQRYQSASMQCQIRIRTLTGKTLESISFPFYERGAFNEKIIGELTKQ